VHLLDELQVGRDAGSLEMELDHEVIVYLAN
jgi:hypothetical protein